MEANDQRSSGLFTPLRRIAATALSTVHNRIELFALELREEKLWLITTVLWAAAVVFFGLVAMLMVSFTVVFLCPRQARPYVLVGLCLIYIAAALSTISCLRRQLKNHPPSFSDTLSEIKKDITWIQSRD